MKAKRFVLSVVGLGCVALLFAVVSVANSGAQKLELCHVPPGDPSDAHTITVGLRAAESHLANHDDNLGPCVTACAIAGECDDGDLCTSDNCLPSGFCENLLVDCDDGEECTEDTCGSATGCVNTDRATGTLCGVFNPCSISRCKPAADLPFTCRIDAIEEDGTVCDDGEACTTNDRCLQSFCFGFVTECDCFDYRADDPIVPPFCDDGSVCTLNDQCSFSALQCTGRFEECRCGVCDPVLGCLGECASDGDCSAGSPSCCLGGPQPGCCQSFCGPA